MLAVHVTLIALFLALAAIFHQGKGGFLLTGGRGPGWKKRRAAERDLCQRAGRLCLALAAAWAGQHPDDLVVALGMLAGRDLLFWLGLTLFCAAAVAGAWEAEYRPVKA